MSHQSEQPILHQIHDLVAEEHRLRSTHTGIGLNSAERKRLEEIEQQLDRCWDALRQRRAAEEYGTEDRVRTPDTLDDDEYSDEYSGDEDR